MSTTASNKPVPRRSKSERNNTKTADTSTAHNQTPPSSPPLQCKAPSRMPYSHSHANQSCPCIVEEKGSVRGRVCVARICSPVRMCHPISASASGRFDKGPASTDQNRKIKMMSRTEGNRKRRANELGCADVITVCIAFLSIKQSHEEAVYAETRHQASVMTSSCGADTLVRVGSDSLQEFFQIGRAHV